MEQPLKIMHVLRPVSGGMRQHLIGLVNHLPQQVETVVVCAAGSYGFQPEEMPWAKIISLNIQGDFDLKNDLPLAQKILQIALAEQVDLIHAHGVKAGLLCLWATLKRRRRFQVICTFHNQFRVSSNRIKNAINRLLVKTLAYQVNHIITVSQAIRKELVEDLNVFPYNKITCIYNGVDLTEFSAVTATDNLLRQEMGISESAVLIGTVARLIPQKGISVLIKAASILRQTHPNVYFAVIGDGPYRETLELEAAGAGLKKFMFFTGYRKNVSQLLAGLDIYTLPTLEEGFSIVTLEAMAVKKPVVVSRVGGLPEIVTSDTGITVAPNQPEQLAAALEQLIIDPQKRQAMGNAAYQRVKDQFTLTGMAQDHFKLYQQLAAGNDKRQKNAGIR